MSTKIKFEVPFAGFEEGTLVVRTDESNANDNRIYVVQAQHGNYYVGRTEVSAVYSGEQFMINTTELRQATPIEQVAHCRLLDDDSIDVVVVL